MSDLLLHLRMGVNKYFKIVTIVLTVGLHVVIFLSKMMVLAYHEVNTMALLAMSDALRKC